MRRPIVPLALFGLSLVAACGDDATVRPPPPAVEEVEAPTAEADPDRLFDDEGNLLESDEVVAGLRLPRGLEPAGQMERLHAYRTSVPIEKVQAYFGPRLITGQVDRHGSASTFRDAVPRDARGGIVRLDVAIIPMNRSATRVEIREIPPPPANMPDEGDILRRWNEDQQQLD